MNNEQIAEKHCEKIDRLAEACSAVVTKKMEQIMGRSLSIAERDEIVEELQSYCKVVVAMQLLDIITNTEKEKQNESERPSNTLS